MTGEIRMRLLYGVTEAENWWQFSLGPHRERIWARLREVDTRIIRIFLFDKRAPDPVTDWETFAAYVQAVLNVGATPMVTFARFYRPFDDPRAVRWFAQRCADVVWGCIEQWGGEVVRDWYWCVWNEPNSDWIGGGLTFDQYRRVYEEVASGICRWLGPHLNGGRALIGGPAVEGFLPFWIDWYWRFIHEIDARLIGFVNWHRYGEWRKSGEEGAPRAEDTYRALLMSRTPEYESRARTVNRLVEGRGILNLCGELNTHSHYEPRIRARYNQTVFGATFYTSALIHLMKGGADAEMFWTGTDDAAGYGMMDRDGTPTPVFHAKKLCTQYIRRGDRIAFPSHDHYVVDAAISRGENGRRSALLVHRSGKTASYPVADLVGELGDATILLKLDEGTGDRVVERCCTGLVTFDGYGVAVVTNAVVGTGEPESGP